MAYILLSIQLHIYLYHNICSNLESEVLKSQICIKLNSLQIKSYVFPSYIMVNLMHNHLPFFFLV